MYKAMILAAGVGSRLDPITKHIAKPLVPILNRPIYSHILALLRYHGINSVISNVHYLAETIESYYADHPILDMSVNFFYEKTLSGDAGGVRECRDFFQNSTFIVIMGDLLTDVNITHLIEEHKKSGALASIAIKEVEDVTRFGVVLLDDYGFIKGFQEKPNKIEALSNYISCGIYILEPEIFDHIPKSGMYGFGKQFFPDLLKKNIPVYGININSYWSDIGTLDDLFKANFDALEKRVKTYPSVHVDTNFEGKRDYFDENKLVFVDKSTDILPLSLLKNFSQVIIGANCEINPKSILSNCLILENTKLTDSEVLHDCILGYGEKISLCV